jgi:hypothetical protein
MAHFVDEAPLSFPFLLEATYFPLYNVCVGIAATDAKPAKQSGKLPAQAELSAVVWVATSQAATGPCNCT